MSTVAGAARSLTHASARLIDGVLDASVVGGYTSVGYSIRRSMWHWEDAESIEERLVLITGATSGIGFAAALGFARAGARLVLLARDADRARALLEPIEAAGRYPARIELCDLSSLQSVRDCAARLSDLGPIGVLVNNAGVLPDSHQLTSEGFELTFATNVLGPFLLTTLLLDQLRAGAPARVITVSSGGMYTQRLSAHTQVAADGFDGVRAYAVTKRQELVLSDCWAHEVPAQQVGFFAMHPGWVDTPGVRDSLPRFHRVTGPLLRDPDAGADTIVWLGTDPDLEGLTGGFWHDRRRRPEHLLPWTREQERDRWKLWEECRRLAGLDGT